MNPPATRAFRGVGFMDDAVGCAVLSAGGGAGLHPRGAESRFVPDHSIVEPEIA